MRTPPMCLSLAFLLRATCSAQTIPDIHEILRQASAGGASSGPIEASAAPGSPSGPVIAGDFPGGAGPGLAAKLANVWEFVQKLGGAPAGLPPPTLVFSPFDPAKQAPDWTRWQSDWVSRNPQIHVDWLCNYAGAAKYPEPTDSGLCGHPAKVLEWMARHPEVRREFPFPATFRAFHYDGTDHIQINPYTTYVGTLLQGVPLDQIGYGYYVTGHEMLHYVLDRRGIPGETHHCLFMTPQPPDGKSYMDRLADFLIDEKHYSNFLVRRMGVEAEKSLNPCGKAAP